MKSYKKPAFWIIAAAVIACAAAAVCFLTDPAGRKDPGAIGPAPTDQIAVPDETPQNTAGEIGGDTPDPTVEPTDEDPAGDNTPFTGYTLRITRPDFPIFDGPSYDHSYVGAVEYAGTYTIVEEQTDDEGNTWGRLKSGAGWVNVTEARAEAEIRFPISAMFASDALLSAMEYHEYRGEESEYAVRLLFTANEILTDVRFSLLQYETGTLDIGEELASLPELRPEKPFVANVVFYGDMTTYGISFTDAGGKERHFSVFISGRNGALLLDEYEP